MVDETLKKAVANCAWRDAVNPNYAEQLRTYVGSNKAPATYQFVLERFGTKAADAWKTAQIAREEFFNAIMEV